MSSWLPIDAAIARQALENAREQRLMPNPPARKPAPSMALSPVRYSILIQELRIAGWTRKELARLAMLPPATLSLIEKGTTRWIYPETARRLDDLWQILDLDVAAAS